MRSPVVELPPVDSPGYPIPSAATHYDGESLLLDQQQRIPQPRRLGGAHAVVASHSGAIAVNPYGLRALVHLLQIVPGELASLDPPRFRIEDVVLRLMAVRGGPQKRHIDNVQQLGAIPTPISVLLVWNSGGVARADGPNPAAELPVAQHFHACDAAAVRPVRDRQADDAFGVGHYPHILCAICLASAPTARFGRPAIPAHPCGSALTRSRCASK